MTNRQILNHIRELAHEECTNYHAGYCALTDERCHIISPNDPSAQDGAIDCDYFLENVLPAGWDVQDVVAYALWYGADDNSDPAEAYPDSLRQCAVCQKPYLHAGDDPDCCEDCESSFGG